MTVVRTFPFYDVGLLGRNCMPVQFAESTGLRARRNPGDTLGHRKLFHGLLFRCPAFANPTFASFQVVGEVFEEREPIGTQQRCIAVARCLRFWHPIAATGLLRAGSDIFFAAKGDQGLPLIPLFLDERRARSLIASRILPPSKERYDGSPWAAPKVCSPDQYRMILRTHTIFEWRL